MEQPDLDGMMSPTLEEQELARAILGAQLPDKCPHGGVPPGGYPDCCLPDEEDVQRIACLIHEYAQARRPRPVGCTELWAIDLANDIRSFGISLEGAAYLIQSTFRERLRDGPMRAYHVTLDALGAPEDEWPCNRVKMLVEQLRGRS
jgi:hypothetical protein